MTKRVKTRETLGAKIYKTLADNVNDLFHYGMNEDQLIELAKDENDPRPENCEGLAIVMGYNITTTTICRTKDAGYTKS